MGQKNTALKVTSGLRLQGDCGSVDGVRLCCRKTCCCGRKARLLAAFTFPGKDEETGPRAAAQVATVKVGRLMKKDGETPVTVTCLAGGTPVLEKEMTLADLLRGLKCTTKGRQAALFFCLVGEKKEGGSQAYTALFCNGRRLGDGGTAGRTGGVLGQASPDAEDVFQDALDQASPDPEADFQDALDQVSPDPEADFQDAEEKVSLDSEADLEEVSLDSEADLDEVSLDYDADVESVSLDSEDGLETISLDSEVSLDSGADLEEVSLDYEADLESVRLESEVSLYFEDDLDTGWVTEEDSAPCTTAPQRPGGDTTPRGILRQRRKVGGSHHMEQHTPTQAKPARGCRARGRGRVGELLDALQAWVVRCCRWLALLLIQYNE